MSVTLDRAFSRGTISSVANREITTTVASGFSQLETSELADYTPRAMVILTGDAQGQWRKIVSVSGNVITLQSPFDYAPLRGETFSNGDRVAEVNPADGDEYCITWCFGDLGAATLRTGITYSNSLDSTFNRFGYSSNADSYDSWELIQGQEMNIGDDADLDDAAWFYDEWKMFKADFRDVRVIEGTGSGRPNRSGLILGNIHPGFDETRVNWNATGQSDDDIPVNGLVYHDGSIYRNVSGAQINDLNASTEDFTDTDNWDNSLDDVSGSPEGGMIIMLTDREVWASSDGDNRGSGEGSTGDVHFNGCQMIVHGAGAGTGSTATPDDDLTSGGRMFWRWYPDNDAIFRFINCHIVGPFGARLRGEKSMVLNCTFDSGGNTLGTFNPTFTGDSYFGLVSGNKWNSKSQVLYVWFQQGDNVQLVSPEISGIRNQFLFFNNGTVDEGDKVDIVNFDINLLDTGMADDAFFINTNHSSSEAHDSRVNIVQDVDVQLINADGDDDNRAAKLIWVDSQNRRSQDHESTTQESDIQTIAAADNGTFNTVRLLKWKSAVLLNTNQNYTDGTDYGTGTGIDFGVISYLNQNTSFAATLYDGALNRTQRVLNDTEITESDIDTVGGYSDLNGVDEIYDYQKYWKYTHPHGNGANGIIDPDVQYFNKGSNTLSFGTGTVDAVNVTFDTAATARFAYHTTNGITIDHTANENILANLNIGKSSDVDVNGETIGGSINCREILNDWADGDTIIQPAENIEIEIDSEIKLNTGTYTIDASADGCEVDISSLTLTRNDGETNCNVLLKGNYNGSPTVNNVNLRKEVTITINLDENYDSDNSSHAAHATDSANDLEGSDLSDSSPDTSVDNQVSFTFEIDEDQKLSFCLLVDQYEPYYVLTENNVTATMTKYNTAILDTSQTTDAVDSVSGATTATWDTDSTPNRVEVLMPNTALGDTTTNQAKSFIWKCIRDTDFAQVVAQRRITVGEIGFEEVGVTIDEDPSNAEQYRIYFTKTAGTAGIEPNCELKTPGGTDLSSDAKLVNVDDTQQRVRFNKAANINIINVATLEQITDISKDNLEEVLDERHLTDTNVVRLGKLQTVQTS